jgi:predicted RNA binding protein YcfA (HicA-like mRNA interferase family)
MRLPRDVNGDVLVKALRKLDYQPTRQRGSHIRVTTHRHGEHHEVIPLHRPIKPGLLASVLKSIAAHHRLTLQQLIELLDL